MPGDAVRREELLALSAMTLVEIGMLFGEDRTRLRIPMGELLADLRSGVRFQVVPIDVEIAAEIAALGKILRDPADRTIVATARVHGLRLVTSDQRIIESKLVPIVE